VRWSYSGIRPLLESENAGNPSAVTRDYLLEVDARPGEPPLLSLFGGKMTTFRKLAEEAVDKLGPALGSTARAWTSAALPPGDDIADADFARLFKGIKQQYAWLPDNLAHRYAHAYGTRLSNLVGKAKSLADLGERLAPSLYEAELHYLRDHEWATRADYVLWRRSKLGLHIARPHLDGTVRRIGQWFISETAAA
jgi:glycerol-3-phosphate dehydrogenase